MVLGIDSGSDGVGCGVREGELNCGFNFSITTIYFLLCIHHKGFYVTK